MWIWIGKVEETHFFKGNTDRVDSVGLPRAHAEQLTVLGDRDRVGLDMLHAAPCKLEVLQLLSGRLRLGNALKRDVLWHQ